MSRLSKPQPVQPIVVNFQISLVAETENLPDTMKRFMAFLEEIGAAGKRRMDSHNEEIRKAQQNGHDPKQQEGAP